MGASELFGCELSILAFTLRVLVFLQMVRWVGSERHAVPLVLLYGCLPSAVLHGSVILRESYQMLAMLLVVWLLTRMTANPAQIWNYVGLILSLIFLGALHNGLVVLSLGLALVAGLWTLRLNPWLSLVVVVPVCLTLVVYYQPIVRFLETHSLAARAISQGRLTSLVEDYRAHIWVTRTNYGGRLEATRIDRFLLTFPPVLTSYMFAPFPWQATGLKDLYALSESAFRLLLTWGLVWNLMRVERARRGKILALTLVFLLVETIWAVATSNWGQAIRHRLVAYSFFLLIGAEPYLDVLFPASPEHRDSLAQEN